MTSTSIAACAAAAAVMLTIAASPASAAPTSPQVSFTCSSNAECKRKCEALGSDHTWHPNPGGSTWGRCVKRRASLFQWLFKAPQAGAVAH